MPFHTRLLGILTPLTLRAARVGVAIKVLWPGMRTIGWLGEQLEPRIVGVLPEFLQDPARRALAAGRLFAPLPTAYIGSFRRGVAYRDIPDVAEGWLNFFPELLVAGTTDHRLIFGISEAVFRNDWVAVLDVLVDRLAESKLEDPVAFLRGVTHIGQDMETVAGAPGAMTWVTTILGEALNRINDGRLVDTHDILDFFRGFERRPGEEPSEFEERLRDDLGDVLEGLFGAQQAIQGVVREFRIPKDDVDESEAVLQKALRIIRAREG